MPTRLWIVRHGEAQSHAASDAQRPLTSRGQADALRVGEVLAEQLDSIDQVRVSPYLRAQQTAIAMMRSITATRCDDWELLVPESDPQQLLEQLADSQVESLLLVSHQPLVSHLVSLLAGCDSGHHGVSMAPASIACLEGELMPGCMRLVGLRHAPLFELVR